MHPVGCVISSALPHAPCFSRVVTPNSTLSWRFSQPRSTDFWRQRILGCGGCPGHHRAMPVAPSVWQTMLPGICQMSPVGKESALAETVWGLGLLSTPPIQAQTPASPQHTQDALARDLPPETGVCSTLRTRKECGTQRVLCGLWPQNTHWLGQVFLKCGRKTIFINGVTTNEPMCREAKERQT